MSRCTVKIVDNSCGIAMSDIEGAQTNRLEGPALRAHRPDVTMATVEGYLHNFYRVRPDFVYSVSRDFTRSCRTPMLVPPDDSPAHPHQSSVDVASLAPNAEITVFPWREPPELKARTIDRVRTFLKAHILMRAAAQ